MKRRRRHWTGNHFLVPTREAAETWTSPVVLPHWAAGEGEPPPHPLPERSIRAESKRAGQHPVPRPWGVTTVAGTKPLRIFWKAEEKLLESRREKEEWAQCGFSPWPPADRKAPLQVEGLRSTPEAAMRIFCACVHACMYVCVCVFNLKVSLFFF